MDHSAPAAPAADACDPRRLEALRLANAYVIAGISGDGPPVDLVMKQAQRYFQFLSGMDYPESALVPKYSEWLETRKRENGA